MLFGFVLGAENFCSIQPENFTEIIFTELSCNALDGPSVTIIEPVKVEKPTAKIPSEKPGKKKLENPPKKAKTEEKLDLTTEKAREGLVIAYRKKTCQQLYYNREIPADMRKLTMEKLDCGSIKYKNFDPKKNRYLQADSSEGMKKILAKFGDSKNM